MAQKVARLARDLKPETKLVTFYNNAGVDTKDTLGLFYNTTTLVYYISNYPLVAVSEGDEQYQRNGHKIRLQGAMIKYFIQQQLNCKVSSKVMWHIFQAKQYQATNYGTAHIITNQFLDQDCNGWISSESFQNVDNSRQFSVLAKGTIYIPQDSYAQQSIIKVERFIRKFHEECNFRNILELVDQI